MKVIKLILMIIKNFFPVLFGEIWNFLRASKPVHWILLGLLIILLIGGGIWSFKKYNRYQTLNEGDVSLKEAAKIGEVTTHKLMVQIETPKGNSEDIAGRYRRGDIVLIKEGNFKFSPAETSGFLILKMDLTEKQAEILVRSKMEGKGETDTKGRPVFDSVARRRYAVDLGEIGIAESDQRGREIDKIYKWDIVYEK